MSLIHLKRFKSELILLLALGAMVVAYGYKYRAHMEVTQEKQRIQQEIKEISEVSELKQLWGNKKIGKELNGFKTIVSKEKVKSFEKRSRKMRAVYRDVSVKELNKIVKKLFKTPVQITNLSIEKQGKERYNMELTCKW